MSQCYKCGRELPGNEIECEPFCPPNSQATDEACPDNWVEVDWSKVKTLEDLKLILEDSAMTLIYRLSPNWEKVKKFAKEDSDD